jgi:hypothetical protein
MEPKLPNAHSAGHRARGQNHGREGPRPHRNAYLYGLRQCRLDRFRQELSGPARLHHYKNPCQSSFPHRIPRPLHLRYPLLHFILSISNAWPAPSVDIGRRRACTGCSMSNSAMTGRAIEPDMAPKTWPSSAASPSVSCAPTSAREASKHAAKAQAGTQSSCSKSSNSNSH